MEEQLTTLHCFHSDPYIASKETIATQDTMRKVIHLLDCLATQLDTVIMFRASNKILNVHSDASYLSEKKTKSRMSVYFLGMCAQEEQRFFINGSIHVFCRILRPVVCSAAETELTALFLNMKEAKILQLTLEEIGQKQPATQVLSVWGQLIIYAWVRD